MEDLEMVIGGEMVMGPHFICAMMLSLWAPSTNTTEEIALATCEDIVAEAYTAQIDPVLVAVLAYTESRLNPKARSKAGAVGPLQVLPKYHCPNGREKGCDLIYAGINALIKFKTRWGKKGWKEVLCHWNSGNKCNRRSRYFARAVLRRKAELEKFMEDEEFFGCE